MKTRVFWLALASLIAAAAAEVASLEGPRLGIVFVTNTKALRPILGIPGAAILGEPLEARLELEQAAVSPQQDYALATTGEGREVVLLHLGSTSVSSATIHGVAPGPDQIAFSSLGRAAALYYKHADRIQVLTGLAGAPRTAAELYLSAGQSPSALAISDDGRVALAGIAGTVFWITADGEVPLLDGLVKIASIALAGHDAIVSDFHHNRIYRIRDITGDAETQVLAGPDQGIAQPVAVAVSRDNHRAFVANYKSGAVTILDLRGEAAPAKIACACKPTGLNPLAGDSFRLTEPSSRPIWVLDAGGHKPRVVFVPGELPPSSKK